MGVKAIYLPELGEGVTEGEILKIKVSQGEKISMDQVLVEVMTDKASMEVPSSINGLIEKVEVKEGDIVPVGTKLFTIKSSEEDSALEQTQKNQPSKSADEKKEEHKKEDLPEKKSPSKKLAKDIALAIPAVRKLAEELGLDLQEVQGTGPQGEIKRQDLLKHIKSRLSGSTRTPLSSPPVQMNFEEDKREPLRGLKRLMFESMTLSKATIPHFTIGEQACVTYLTTIKTEMKSRLEKQGLKTGYLPFFIKALIPVLKEFPIFNSSYDSQSKEIVFKKDLNIGFALDSPEGLLVPVLKKAQNKSLLEMIKELNLLAEQARKGNLKREQLTGAGITISNLGSLGGFYGTPIINPPEMAIIGAYSLFYKTSRDKQGEFKELPFINFSITCDHRFIDGATAARFLKSFVAKIEEPSLLILD